MSYQVREKGSSEVWQQLYSSLTEAWEATGWDPHRYEVLPTGEPVIDRSQYEESSGTHTD